MHDSAADRRTIAAWFARRDGEENHGPRKCLPLYRVAVIPRTAAIHSLFSRGPWSIALPTGSAADRQLRGGLSDFDPGQGTNR